MRTHVDLFSGIGGFSLACEWAGVQTIAFAEIDKYASRVLQRHWPNVRNYGDVRGLPSLSAWLLTAGVPCQPASVAGKRKGAADDRWFWPQTLAVVENGSYEWLLFENPTGILSLNDGLEFERICVALESKGYEVQPLVIPACAVGAPHRRDRVWIMAHSKHSRWRESARTADPARQSLCATKREEGAFQFRSGSRDVAHAERLQWHGRGERIGWWDREPQEALRHFGRDRWEENGLSITESELGRVVNGPPVGVDRLRCLGNGIVPSIPYQLIKRMIEAEEFSFEG